MDSVFSGQCTRNLPSSFSCPFFSLRVRESEAHAPTNCNPSAHTRKKDWTEFWVRWACRTEGIKGSKGKIAEAKTEKWKRNTARKALQKFTNEKLPSCSIAPLPPLPPPLLRRLHRLSAWTWPPAAGPVHRVGSWCVKSPEQTLRLPPSSTCTHNNIRTHAHDTQQHRNARMSRSGSRGRREIEKQTPGGGQSGALHGNAHWPEIEELCEARQERPQGKDTQHKDE